MRTLARHEIILQTAKSLWFQNLRLEFLRPLLWAPSEARDADALLFKLILPVCPKMLFVYIFDGESPPPPILLALEYFIVGLLFCEVDWTRVGTSDSI